MLRSAETILFMIILTSSLRHPLNSCGANAHHSPEPVEGFVPLSKSPSPPPQSSSTNLTTLSPSGQSDGARATRGETNETPCVGSVPRVCDRLFARCSFFALGNLGQLCSPRRVHSPKLASADLLGGGFRRREKGRIAWWAGDPGIHLPSMRWLLFLVHPGVDW